MSLVSAMVAPKGGSDIQIMAMLVCSWFLGDKAMSLVHAMVLPDSDQILLGHGLVGYG